MKEKLEELSIAGALAHTTSAFRDQGEDPWPEEAGLDTWDAALPPDLKRAGPEIYTSMKSAGVRCVRDWINSMFSVDQRQHPQYVELFNLASLVDQGRGLTSSSTQHDWAVRYLREEIGFLDSREEDG